MNPNNPSSNNMNAQHNHPHGSFPMFPPYMSQPSGYPLQPPPTGMPFMPSMMPGMPQMFAPPAPPPMYPPGQGPLADVSATRGANGLYQAPELEGPEPHEAKPFLRLNPAEVSKYIEYWDEASEGNESVSGAHAVAFLARASKVSKSQLRRIWEIADHRKEGSLEQEQFFIALRLVALAQRGAELSVSGLRNFTGIQLIPEILPPRPPTPEPEPELEPESEPPAEALRQPPLDGNSTIPSGSGMQTGFSWQITKPIAQKFDGFFDGLLPDDGQLLDAATAVPFFVKSGLPRPTLRKIWQLADVGQDGKLSRDEFRVAMHLVTCLRNRRVTLDALPDHLDPSGPNWLRIAGEQIPLSQGPESSMNDLLPPSETFRTPGENNHHSPSANFLPPTQLRSDPPSSMIGNEGMLPEGHERNHHIPVMQPAVGAENRTVDPDEFRRQEMVAEREERRRMLEELRLEREEMERTRREMESMRAEMLRLRMGDSSSTPASVNVTNSSPPQIPVELPSTVAPPVQSPLPPHSTSQNIQSDADSPAILLDNQNESLQKSLNSFTDKGQSLPSDAGESNTGKSFKESHENDKAVPQNVEDSSSDDDDDFWGGLGPKPSLGTSGNKKPDSDGTGGSSAGVGKTFGGSELDDWVF